MIVGININAEAHRCWKAESLALISVGQRPTNGLFKITKAVSLASNENFQGENMIPKFDEIVQKLRGNTLPVTTIIALLFLGGCGNGKDDNKEVATPLHNAVEKGNFELVQQLVAEGADVNAKGILDRTPLHLAMRVGYDGNVYNGLFQCVVLEEKDKKEVEGGKKNINNPQIHYETPSSYFEIIQFLVSEGADVNATDRTDSTPLHLAAVFPRLDVIQFLVSKGADIHTRNRLGDTPLHLAAAYNRLDGVKYLVSQGADVNAKNGSGETPLLRRATTLDSLVYQEIVQFLVSEGADVNVQDNVANGGNTPLHYAAAFNLLEAVQLLVSQGADVNVKNRNGHTPLDLSQDDEVIAFLKKSTIVIQDKQ